MESQRRYLLKIPKYSVANPFAPMFSTYGSPDPLQKITHTNFPVFLANN